jgi:hypothetical protein
MDYKMGGYVAYMTHENAHEILVGKLEERETTWDP